MKEAIYIGFDPRECGAFAVACYSIRKHLSRPIPVEGLVLSHLQRDGLYKRPTSTKLNGEGRVEIVDELSIRPDYDGRVSTWHANARFFIGQLAKTGWALFLDGDTLIRGDLATEIFDKLDPKYAAYCVKHNHEPTSTTKMDGQVQTRYARKNWTSVFALNLDHPANQNLTLEVLNTAPGRDLHAFCWLADCDIGEIDPKYNFLVGHSDPAIDPVVIHHTEGVPDMPGFENVAFADDWRMTRDEWARAALSLPA